jgi:hypothetical protein
VGVLQPLRLWTKPNGSPTAAALPAPIGSRAVAACMRHLGLGLAEHRPSERRPPVRTGLVPEAPRRRLAPLGQLREALARHNARLNANSSDICCSRSTKISRLSENDLALTDINYPTAMGVLDHRTMKVSADFCTFRSQTLGSRRLKFGPSIIRIPAPYARFI